MAAAPLRTRQESSHSANKRGSAASSRLNVYATPLPLCIDEATLLYSIAWLLHASVQKLSYALLGRAPSRNPIPETGYLAHQVRGYWDEATASVWILPRRTRKKARSRQSERELPTSEQSTLDESEMHDMYLMWNKGFFGKGSLSRSEPTWWQREKNRVSGQHVLTAEDFTAQRRADRKIHKAKKAQERLEERDKQATAMIATQASLRSSSSPTTAALELPTAGAVSIDAAEESLNLEHGIPADTTARPRHTKARAGNTQQEAADQAALLVSLGIDVPNQEHVQLQREEAMFLAFGIGVLQVMRSIQATDDNEQTAIVVPLPDLWQTFCQASLLPSHRLEDFERSMLRPDNPFILSYVVYHHYRSLGWVVRNGIKFCVDWILYKGADGVPGFRGGAGPVGGHAEFAVVVIPTYEDPADAPSEAVLHYRRDWTWLNTVNRVCAGVKKTVILAYVRIPAMIRLHSNGNSSFPQLFNPGCLKLYEIKEVALKRFIPSRMRD